MSDSDTGPDRPEDMGQRATAVGLEEEMRRSYLDYAMSVIVARALPDARDGLKPVHRRILFAMQESGFTADKPHRKSARVTGDVMGKYHPHGDASIYDAMVRMAQSFSMRVPLIDGQGNFGSRRRRSAGGRCATPKCGWPAPPPRCWMASTRTPSTSSPTTTRSENEPKVLPAAFPNLLVNGANGIAVGMATNIPPHNPGEVIDATLALIADPTTPLARDHGDHARAGFPDRRPHPRPRRHPLRLRDRPRLHPAARQMRHRGDARRPSGHHRHRDPLSGQ